MNPPQSKLRLTRRKTTTQGCGGVSTRLQRDLQMEIVKRQQADFALRQAESRYQSIFEHAIEGIFQSTQEGKYISANPALVKLYGYGSFEELSQGVDDIASQIYVDPSRRSEFMRLIHENGQVLHFESEVRRRDGKTLWISENVRTVLDDEGNFLYYEGTVDDITELKQSRLQLQKMVESLEATQKRLELELHEAACYVRSLLPKPLTGSVETEWCYLPSSQLGGDGFGYHWLDSETLAFYLFDVSGHGVGSALLSISVMNLLRSQSLPKTNFRDPSAVLEGLNRAFPMEENNDKYFTAWYGVYHLPTRTLTYASGGQHGAVLVCEGGSKTRLQTDGFGVGFMPDLSFPAATVTIPADASIYLFSDGVYEIHRSDGSWQSWEEFTQHLQQNLPGTTDILQRMKIMRAPAEFEDDFAVLKLKLP